MKGPISRCFTVSAVKDGKPGKNGIDAQDVEWAYIRSKTPVAPVIYQDEQYTDSSGRLYISDNHLPQVESSVNIENNHNRYECTDDPKGVDNIWKYEWEIKRTKGDADENGKRTWNYYNGTMTLHNNYSESAFIIDIDNDNDQFATDSESKVLVAQNRSTTVSLYDGATPQTLTALAATMKYEDGTNVPSGVAVVTADTSSGIITVTVKVNSVANPHTEILVNITAICAKGSKNAVFTLRKIMGGAPGLNPVIYQLAPTQKSFSFYRDSNNNLLPASLTSQINVAKTEGNTTTIVSSALSGITYKWGFDDSTTALGTERAVGSIITISKTQAASHYQVWIELSTGDRETLPIIKDGANGISGESPWIADCDNEMDSVLTSSIGVVSSLQQIHSQLSIYHGSDNVTVEIMEVRRNGEVIAVRSEEGADYVYASWNTTGLLTISYHPGSTFGNPVREKDEFTIKLRPTNKIQIERYIIITVLWSEGVIYNLNPQFGQINVGRTENGGYLPSLASITCGYKKRDINGEETGNTDYVSTIENKWNIYFRFRIRAGVTIGVQTFNDATWDSIYRRYGVSRSLINPFSVQLYDAVEFVLCSNTEDETEDVNLRGIKDREVVPVVADGVKGDDSIFYFIETNVDSITIPSNQSSVLAGLTGSFYKMTGAEKSSFICAFIMWRRDKSGNYTRLAYARSVQSFDVSDYEVDYDTDALIAVMQETLTNDHTVYIAKKEIPIIRDGTSGTTVQTLYRSTNSSSAPAAPTGDSPSGWSEQRTAITTGNRYRYVTSRYSDDGGASWTAWSAPVLDAYLAENGTSIRIKGQAVAIAQGSQTLDDVDRAYSGGIPDGGIVLMNSTADTADDAFLRAMAANDWIEIPVTEGDGYLLDGHLWMRTSVSGASNPTKRWQDCGQIQGPKGDDAVLYTLECNPSKINFRSNAAGEFSGSFTVAAVIRKITGNATPVIINEGSTTGVYLFCRREGGIDSRWHNYSSSTNRTVTASQAIASTYPVTSISICLSTESNYRGVADSNILSTANIPVICDGRRGAVGATGKMFYPMGVWNANVEYVKEDESIPLVWVDDLNTIDPATGEYGAYWYLTADSDTGHKPQDGSAYWAKASHFGLVITQGIFAEFARLGKFIMTGDWMLSTNGTIDGVAYNNGQLYNDKPAYMWFNPEYPNTDHITNNKHNFLPNYAVDGLTGRSYQNSAFIRGEVHATSGEFTGTIHASQGNIGGFFITPRALTNDAAERGDIVQIQNTFIRSTIGACEVPTISSDILYGARISSDFFSNEPDTLNVAIRARARGSGAAKNFAFHGWGHVVTRGMAVGYQLQIMGFTNSEYASYINIKSGNIVLLKDTEPGREKFAILPTLLNVRDSLRIPSNEPFAVKLTLLIQSDPDTQMHILGYQSGTTYTGDDYPPHQRDNYFTDHPNHDVEPGQVYTYMLVWDGISGHTHYNAWLAGYGDRGY